MLRHVKRKSRSPRRSRSRSRSPRRGRMNRSNNSRTRRRVTRRRSHKRRTHTETDAHGMTRNEMVYRNLEHIYGSSYCNTTSCEEVKFNYEKFYRTRSDASFDATVRSILKLGTGTADELKFAYLVSGFLHSTFVRKRPPKLPYVPGYRVMNIQGVKGEIKRSHTSRYEVREEHSHPRETLALSLGLFFDDTEQFEFTVRNGNDDDLIVEANDENATGIYTKRQNGIYTRISSTDEKDDINDTYAFKMVTNPQKHFRFAISEGMPLETNVTNVETHVNRCLVFEPYIDVWVYKVDKTQPEDYRTDEPPNQVWRVMGNYLITKDEPPPTDVCAICHNDFVVNGQHEHVNVLHCGHMFHEKCFALWEHVKGDNVTCPTCRTGGKLIDAKRVVFRDNVPNER